MKSRFQEACVLGAAFADGYPKTLNPLMPLRQSAGDPPAQIILRPRSDFLGFTGSPRQ